MTAVPYMPLIPALSAQASFRVLLQAQPTGGASGDLAVDC